MGGALRSHLGLPTLSFFVQSISALAGSDIEMEALGSRWRNCREDLYMGAGKRCWIRRSRPERKSGEERAVWQRLLIANVIVNSPSSWFSC